MQKLILPKCLITVDEILKLFSDNKEDCDVNSAREIIQKIYLMDYFSILFLYGETPLLLILEYLESKEEYETCGVIIKTIEEQNKINSDTIKTRR